MLSAEELHRRGTEAINAGRVRVARPLLESALDRTGDPALTARVEASLAYVAADLGEADAALALCARALTRPGIPDQTRGIVLSQRALLLMRAGRTHEALESFAGAIDSLHDLPADLAKAHINRGGVYLQQGNPRAASADFAAAVVQFDRAGDPLSKAKAEHNLGYASLLEGDLVRALDAMEAAYTVIAPVSPVLRAICEQDRAEALLAAGLVTEGTRLLSQAARSYGARRLRQRQAEAELTLARSLLTQSPEPACAAARRARARFRALGAEAWRVRADATALAAEVELGRRGPALLARGDALVAELSAQGLRWTATTIRLHAARVLVRRDDLENARTRLARVRIDEEAPLAVRLLARDVRAELAARRGDRAAALAQLREGLTDLHLWQSSFGSLDLQTMVTGHGTRLAVRGLALAVASGRPAVLFEWSERARMLASRVTPVRAPADETIALDLAELRRLAASADGPRSPGQGRDTELRRRVREKAWQHRGSGEVSEPCTLDELRAALGPDTALVAYVVTRARVVALTVTDGPARVHDLGGRDRLDALLGGLLPDLDVAAADLPGPVATAVRDQLAGRLADLAELLVAPLAGAVGGRRLVLTPSGLLAGVPWPLLPGFRGSPVTVAQSASSWLARRAEPLHTRTAGFVAGPRVVRAEHEVTAAARAWPGAEVLTGPAATAGAVSDLAARVDVLHVAAHGRHSAENPMFSGLELADGPWFGYDIDQLRAVPDVVLLSACEAGRSSVRHGEELIGMTAAWLHAGARCVIASAAAVSDEAAHDVLVRLHAGLRSGCDPATALAGALPGAGAGGAPAPFVCFG